MATALTIRNLDRAGAIFSAEGTPEATLFETGDTGSGNTFVNSSKVFVIIWNIHGSNTITATFVTQATVDGYAIADQTVIVTAQEWNIMGPFTAAFEGSNNLVTINWTGSGTPKIMAIKI